MLLDPRDRRPRVRLFDPGQADIQVNIHRCLGTMEDVDDIGGAGCTDFSSSKAGVRLLRASDYDSDEETEGGVKDKTSVGNSTLDERVSSLSDTPVSVPDVPEHMTQLLEETLPRMTIDEERSRLTTLLIAYQNIFAKDETDIGKTDVMTHDDNRRRSMTLLFPS